MELKPISQFILYTISIYMVATYQRITNCENIIDSDFVDNNLVCWLINKQQDYIDKYIYHFIVMNIAMIIHVLNYSHNMNNLKKSIRYFMYLVQLACFTNLLAITSLIFYGAHHDVLAITRYYFHHHYNICLTSIGMLIVSLFYFHQSYTEIFN
jgi:hypothetical protein